MKKLLLLTAFLLAGYFSFANRLLVKSNGTGFAYTSIGEAIDSAQVGDTIVIFPRTDGQQWSLTKTITKPMVFLNGDTSGNNQYLGIGSITINSSNNNGTYYFLGIGLNILTNNSNNKAYLENSGGQLIGKNFIGYKSSISSNGTLDLCQFFYSTVTLVTYIDVYNSISLKNSIVYNCQIYFNTTNGSSGFYATNSKFYANYFPQPIFTFNRNLQFFLTNCNFINNTFPNNSYGKGMGFILVSDGTESTFANNFIDLKILNFQISSTISEGNYFKTADDPNTLLSNGFKQAPANVQLDSIGRIVGNALVDSGATTPWMRDVDGSPADVGITGGPFPIQNYINPNPGNAQIIHVNIPNRVGYPNRPIPIKATGTSK